MTDTDDLVDALVQTSFTVLTSLTRIAAEHELSLTQLRVLAILRDRRVRMSELAAYLGLDRSTLTGLVDRGVARGLLRRLPNEQDGRAVDVTATASGRALARRVDADVRAGVAPLLEALGAADRRRLATLLARFVAA